MGASWAAAWTGDGVYAVGWPQLGREQRWMAAVLACGDAAALSHRSAAALWHIGYEASGWIDVSVRRDSELRRPGLRVRRRPKLPGADIVSHKDIPVTTVPRTLIDLANELGETAVERAVNEADKRDLIDPENLRSVLEKYEGDPGVGLLRKLLDKRTFRLSDSGLEILFRPIAAKPVPIPAQQIARQRLESRLLLAGPGLWLKRTAFAIPPPSGD